MAGQRRGRAYEDLRVGQPAGSGIKPGLLNMLFKGGSVNRQHAIDDTRMGRGENVRPQTSRMLFRGGVTAGEDMRTGHDSGERLEPDDEEMLAGGGPVGGAGGAASDSEKLAAHEVMGALKSGDAMKFLTAMKGLMLILDEDDQGEPEDEGGAGQGPEDGAP